MELTRASTLHPMLGSCVANVASPSEVQLRVSDPLPADCPDKEKGTHSNPIRLGVSPLDTPMRCRSNSLVAEAAVLDMGPALSRAKSLDPTRTSLNFGDEAA